MAITFMSYTDAVNRCLSAIGTSRITSLPVTNRDDVDEAEEIIQEILLEVQAQGWSWNTENHYELTASAGKFTAPNNGIQVNVPFRRYGRNITIKWDGETRRLYDLDEHTFTFTDETLEVDVVWMYEFNYLPQAARWYVATRAARQYAARMLAGESAISGFSVDDEMRALQVLKEHESDTGEYSMFDNAMSHFILDRGVAY